MSSWIPEGREAPSTAAIASAAAILAATVGYFVGQASSIGLFGGESVPKEKAGVGKKSQGWPNNYDVTIHPDSSDEELMEHLRGGQKTAKARGEVADSEDEEQEAGEEERDELGVDDMSGELKTFAGSKEECKLVLCVRTDLGMGKGIILRVHQVPSLLSRNLSSNIATNIQTNARQDSSTSLPRDASELRPPPSPAT